MRNGFNDKLHNDINAIAGELEYKLGHYLLFGRRTSKILKANYSRSEATLSYQSKKAPVQKNQRGLLTANKECVKYKKIT